MPAVIPSSHDRLCFSRLLFEATVLKPAAGAGRCLRAEARTTGLDSRQGPPVKPQAMSRSGTEVPLFLGLGFHGWLVARATPALGTAKTCQALAPNS